MTRMRCRGKVHRMQQKDSKQRARQQGLVSRQEIGKQRLSRHRNSGQMASLQTKVRLTMETGTPPVWSRAGARTPRA